MALSPKLRLVGEGRKRKAAFEAEQTEKARVEELTSLIQQHIVHGKDGKDGVTEVIHTYEPLPEDVAKREEVASIRYTIDSLMAEKSQMAGKHQSMLNELSVKLDMLIAEQFKEEEEDDTPVTYTFSIVRDPGGRIKEVVATPNV